jgi:hypothetical protein
MPTSIATGFDFQPLLDGSILVEFQDNDGKTFNSQVVTGEAFSHISMVVSMTQVAMAEGVEAAKKMMEKSNAEYRQKETES